MKETRFSDTHDYFSESDEELRWEAGGSLQTLDIYKYIIYFTLTTDIKDLNAFICLNTQHNKTGKQRTWTQFKLSDWWKQKTWHLTMTPWWYGGLSFVLVS